jgi:integrase
MQPYNTLNTSEWDWGFMEIGQVSERKRNGYTEYWVEVWWGNPRQRYTFTQIPIPSPRGTEWKSCNRNKALAEFLLSIIRERIKNHVFVPSEFRKQSPMQFDIYAKLWLKMKKPNIGTGHYHVLNWAIYNYLIPQLGTIYLPNISNIRLRQLQNNLESVRKKGVSLDVKTKKNVMDTLSEMLNDACPEYISVVPKFPGFKGSEAIIPPDIKVPIIEDIFKIIMKIPEEDRSIFWFMIFSGCRPSEARAFRKEDIRGDHIMFVKTFDARGNLVPVKGKKPLPFPMTEALRWILDQTPKNLTPQVFVNPRTGRPYIESKLPEIWHVARKEAGFEYLKLYNCTRHAFATLMRKGGMDLADVRDLMRHSDIKMTARYDHSTVIRLSSQVDKILHFPVGKMLASEIKPSN